MKQKFIKSGCYAGVAVEIGDIYYTYMDSEFSVTFGLKYNLNNGFDWTIIDLI